jgi:hypothetical protein
MSLLDNEHNDRIIFFHKHGTSARTRFLRFAEETVCGFAGLPSLAQVVEEIDTKPQPPVETHPTVLLKEAAERLSVPLASLELESEYCMWVDVPGGPVRVLLAGFTDIDPPFDKAEAIGASFVDLTQARSLPQAELLLLRRAYEVVLGG